LAPAWAELLPQRCQRPSEGVLAPDRTWGRRHAEAGLFQLLADVRQLMNITFLTPIEAAVDGFISEVICNWSRLESP
jgi:hypothetical protein